MASGSSARMVSRCFAVRGRAGRGKHIVVMLTVKLMGHNLQSTHGSHFTQCLQPVVWRNGKSLLLGLVCGNRLLPTLIVTHMSHIIDSITCCYPQSVVGGSGNALLFGLLCGNRRLAELIVIPMNHMAQ